MNTLSKGMKHVETKAATWVGRVRLTTHTKPGEEYLEAQRRRCSQNSGAAPS